MKKAYWSGYNSMTVVDLINRVSASIGSPQIALESSYSNFNGHAVSVRFNENRGYWIAEYFWAGREVIARGSFNEVLSAALVFQLHNGACGSVTVYCENAEQAEQCIASKLVDYSEEAEKKAYASLMPSWIASEAVSLVHSKKFKPVNFAPLVKAYEQGLCQEQYESMKEVE